MSEAEAAAIRTAYEQRGELAAAGDLRRYFPAIDSTAKARECVRIIAGWKPLPKLSALSSDHPQGTLFSSAMSGAVLTRAWRSSGATSNPWCARPSPIIVPSCPQERLD